MFKWAEAMSKFTDPLVGVKMNFEVRNLVFTPGIYNDKPVMETRGLLETVKFGHLD